MTTAYDTQTFLPVTQPETGAMAVKKGRVRWSLDPDEAREIADFIERSTDHRDAARNDARALRTLAWAIDGEERPDEPT